MSDNTYIQPLSPWYKGIYSEEGGGGITLAQADARYVRNGGIATLSSLDAGNITISGVSVLTATTGDTRYLQLTGGNLTGAITLNRGNGESYISTNGTVRTAIHTQTSTAHIGTTSNHTFNLQANGVNVLQCLNTGNVNVVNSLLIPSSGLNIGNNITTNSSSDIVIMESVSTPQIEIGRAQTNGNSFNIGYTHVGDGNVLNRLFIQPRGATTNDTLTYTVNGGRVGIGSPTPTQKLEVNGNINVSSGSSYMIGGSSIDNRYLQLSGGTLTSQLYINGSTSTSVSANRRYGVAGTDPSNQAGGTVPVSLRLSSNLWCAGDMYSSSDKRLKKDIVYPELDSMSLLKINPAFYTWKKNNERCFGLIAQDVIKAGLDILVNTFEDESVDKFCDETNTEAGFCHTVEYNKIPLLLIDLCKKLNERITKLEGTPALRDMEQILDETLL